MYDVYNYLDYYDDSAPPEFGESVLSDMNGYFSHV